MEELNKSGKSWLTFDISRSSKGLTLFVKVEPEVEQFIKEFSDGKTEQLETYGRNWYPVDKNKPIRAYRLDKELGVAGSYQLSNLCGSLIYKQNTINLSWLQFQGISDPEGIEFVVTGPFSRPMVETQLPKMILNGCREFFRDYVVPINVHLRISSLNG